MNIGMDSQVRIIVHLGQIKKIVLFDSKDSLDIIIGNSLEKFGYDPNLKNLYSLFWESVNCLIESRIEIRDGDHLSLEEQKVSQQLISSSTDGNFQIISFI